MCITKPIDTAFNPDVSGVQRYWHCLIFQLFFMRYINHNSELVSFYQIIIRLAWSLLLSGIENTEIKTDTWKQKERHQEENDIKYPEPKSVLNLNTKMKRCM